MRPTQGPSTASRNSRKAPATKVDSRPRPPEVTLITDWPIIAQPAMPPRKPVAVLARPWPTHSRLRWLGVSVMSSTICRVIIDSSRPTTASVADTGSRMRSVSQLSGTSGMKNAGSRSGSWPMSPTVRTSMPKPITTAVSSTIDTRGDGTTRVSRGSR